MIDKLTCDWCGNAPLACLKWMFKVHGPTSDDFQILLCCNKCWLKIKPKKAKVKK